MYEKEGEKIEKYQDLKREIGRLWGISHLEVVLVVVGAHRIVSKSLDAWLEKLGVRDYCLVRHSQDLKEAVGQLKEKK